MSRSFTVEEIAELAGLTATTIKRLIRRKAIRAHRSRIYLIDASNVKQFLLDQDSLCKAGRRKKAAGKVTA